MAVRRSGPTLRPNLSAPRQVLRPPFRAVHARGGSESTIVVDGVPYRLHVFDRPGSWTFDVLDAGSEGLIEYLAVGGGGAGGGRHAGAGGGGTVIYNRCFAIESGIHPAVVGRGGVGRSGTGWAGGDGEDSQFIETAFGGGGGGSFSGVNARPGGSGGGGGHSPSLGAASINMVSALESDVFGSVGGDGASNEGGGGGGAGGPGHAAVANVRAGDGGPGVRCDILGLPLLWGAGGGGGGWTEAAGDGGAGGGGGGGRGNSASPAGRGGVKGLQPGVDGVTGFTGPVSGGDGAAGTGSGGGGSGQASSGTYVGKGGDGGSGIVAVRYPLAHPRPAPAPAAPASLVWGGDMRDVAFPDGVYRLHVFDQPGSHLLSVQGADVQAGYAVVAGGGGGGSAWGGGGGGAGGALFDFEEGVLLATGDHTILVGAGGSGGPGGGSSVGGRGGDSSAFDLTAFGGGGGGGHNSTTLQPTAGGSGGGQGHAGDGAPGTDGQGHAGGAALYAANPGHSAGGGGGAGGPGEAASGVMRDNNSGRGGPGVDLSAWAGDQVGVKGWFAGGGGGGGGPRYSGYSSGGTGIGAEGGAGGGGRGADGNYNGGFSAPQYTGLDAALATGSGGGGGSYKDSFYPRAGSGAGGVVIVRYKVAELPDERPSISGVANGVVAALLEDGFAPIAASQPSEPLPAAYEIQFDGSDRFVRLRTAWGVKPAGLHSSDLQVADDVVPFVPLTASGGDVVFDRTIDGTLYRVHQFTAVGSSELVVEHPGSEGVVEYLVVAGGGGGGNQHGSGGGAGGLRTSVAADLSGGLSSAEAPLKLTQGTYPVVVGAGGAGSPVGSSMPYTQPGQDSRFATVTARGGGAGGSWSSATGIERSAGGSGGGAWQSTSGSAPGGSGVAGQGFRGGNGVPTSQPHLGSGGGGAGAAGETGSAALTPRRAGRGGDGVRSTISGVPRFLAAGGGGGRYWSSGQTMPQGGEGGRGSGGRGGISFGGTRDDGQPGAQNTGSGGGAGGSSVSLGGDGGSGVVYVRYPLVRRMVDNSPRPATLSLVTQGQLPAGLSLDAASGVISGAPHESGPVSFTVTTTGLSGTLTTQVSGAVSRAPDGSSSADAARSAVALKLAWPDLASGVYWIDLPTLGPTRVYCDMEIDGGGWMMLGYAGSTTSPGGNANHMVFHQIGAVAATRVDQQTSFSRFDQVRGIPGAGVNSELLWRRTNDPRPVLLHSLDELWNRMPGGPRAGNMDLNGVGDPQRGWPISRMLMSLSGPDSLTERFGGGRYESGPSYPGIAWRSTYAQNSDGVGSFDTWLNRRSIIYWETNGPQSNAQWFHGTPLGLGPSPNSTGGRARRDIEIYFRECHPSRALW